MSETVRKQQVDELCHVLLIYINKSCTSTKQSMILGNRQITDILKMDLDKPVFLLDMCRVCMMSSDYLKESICYELTPSIIDMLNSFADLNVSLNDCLPSLICSPCYTRLLDSSNFKNLCVKTNITLQSYISKRQVKSASKAEGEQIMSSDIRSCLTKENLKSENVQRKEDIENENTIFESGNVKPLVKMPEPSPEILNALGLIKVSRRTDKKKCESKDSETKFISDKRRKKLFKCSECDYKAVDYARYRRHLTTHGREPYTCKICGKRFSKARLLKEHSEASHSGGTPYSCAKCSSRFSTLSDLTVHVRKHSGNADPHACPMCPRRFATSKQLREHSAAHDSERKLEKYKRSATGSGEHACSQCDRRFRKKCDLERHERVHSGLKPYSCPICGGKFQQAHNLTKHMVTHTGVKSYTCDICHKTFGRSDVLARHMHVHEVNKPHSCERCNRTFARQSQLASHLAKKHPL